MGLNAGGAKVPCNVIILDGTLETCCSLAKFNKKTIRFGKITGNYGVWHFIKTNGSVWQNNSTTYNL